MKKNNTIKRTTVFLIPLIAGLLFTACLHQDMKEGGIRELGSGELELHLTFQGYTAQEDATMIMAYLWEGTPAWEDAYAAGPIDPQGKMFMVNTTETIVGEYSVIFSDLADGTYWCGIFETTGMNFDTAIDTVGYYNPTDTTTLNSLIKPTALIIDANNEHVSIEMMTLVSCITDLCNLCDDDPTNDCVPLVSGDINLAVEFINWEPDPTATMYMAYVWEGSSWSVALAAGEVQNQMFGVFPQMGTSNGTYEVTFTNLPEGTYFSGVFETTLMTHDSAIKLVGYYNSFVDDEHNSQEEPSALQTGENDLEMHAGH